MIDRLIANKCDLRIIYSHLINKKHYLNAFIMLIKRKIGCRN